MPPHPPKTALVTGASRGIGAAIAARLAAEGFTVIVNYAGNAEAAAQVVAGIRDRGGQAQAVQADVTDPAQVERLFDTAATAEAPLKVVVACAGILQCAPLADTEDAMVDRLIDVNLKGGLYTLRAAARRMPDGGRIISLSTSVVGAKLPGYGVYAASKAALETLGAILSKELRGRNITVNAVAPGPTATALFLDGKTDAQIAALAAANPLERLGQPYRYR